MVETSLNHGRRLLPQIVDDSAAADPDRIVYSIAELAGDSCGFRHISAKELVRAIDKTAWWLTSLLGKHESIRSVGYIGPRKF